MLRNGIGSRAGRMFIETRFAIRPPSQSERKAG